MRSTALLDIDSAFRYDIRDVERLVSVATAAAAIAYGVSRRSVPGICLAAAATPFAYRGLVGTWPRLNHDRPTNGYTRVALGGSRGIHVRESIRLEKPLDEVYRFWRRFENLPRFMTHLERVVDLGSGRSHWVAKGRAGVNVEWDAEIINEVENKVIGWRSLPGSAVVTRGVGQFRQGAQRTDHAGVRTSPIRAARWPRDRAPCDVPRSRAIADDPGRPATPEVAARGRRSAQGEAGARRGGEMRAVCYYGKEDMRVERVPDPQILNPRDAIVKITATAICGSDLHIYDGYIPTMEKGDVLGHEFMGEVVEVGRDNQRLKVGDRVVVPFTIACGSCYFCKQQLWSLCDNSNPNAWMAEKLYGYSASGLFGYSHMYGGYPGGQAEFARVPFADVGPLKVPDSLSDEQVLFLSDIFPTGYMAAENCQIKPGDTVAVWGCGPVGQFAIHSAYLLGAERVIAIDRFPERLALAPRRRVRPRSLNYAEVDVPRRCAS